MVRLVLALLLSATFLPAKKRPNILFLFADDQRADTIGAHGNPHIQTPHLDRLAKGGFSFRKNYCAGSFSGAVCVASRAMLMTGQHWMSLPREKPQANWGNNLTLPALLKKTGNYQPFIIGKWHNGKNTLDQSFTNGRSVYMGGMADHTNFEVQDLSNGKLSNKRSAGGFSSSVFADDAISFIKSTQTGNPFFLYVSFMAPHDPRNPPEKYREMYYRNRPPLPKNFLPQHPFQNAPQATSGRDEGLAPWPRTKEMISDQLCEYYGLVTHLDKQVGRILSALKKSAHADNTIVVYTADHGLAMGSHGLLGKQNVYEQSMQCPLIISGPGIPQGKSSDAFTYVHDLYATLCSLVDIKPENKIDSEDLTEIIRGNAKEVRKSLFLPFQDNQRSVNNGKWKLHIYPQINHQLLFNLEKDPHEMNNLSNDPKHGNQLLKMERLMHKWKKLLSDPHLLRSENPLPLKPSYNNAQRVLDRWQPKWIREKYFDGRNDYNHGKK
jgi:arylsulfatase A-like enzyme